ncbi:Esterase PHB depolymerase [Bremerella volcania]|uniref:Esterase PHB depolymerase n=1 Tax=Bremerella volcania TaxID=2527984 RepID=A0A518C449_9BACT|nr:PHB depolymerase family esterase [Bremerella volcania]QDU73987.1 Esterase PHB depolymerase [Bremerella volcania]
MTTTPIKELPPGRHRLTIDSDDREREFWVYIPTQAQQPEAGWPLVFVFHGGLSNAPTMVRFCEMNEYADAAGFVTVFPNGTGRLPTMKTWNAGMCCGYAQREDVNDVHFVELLLADLPRRMAIDPTRIYSTGMSNGGMMSYLLGDKLADRFAAIAPVGGTMGNPTCSPSRPVPLMHIHGTDDQFVRWEGGVGSRSKSKLHFHSVDHAMENWIAANRAQTTPSIESLPVEVNDGTSIERFIYAADGSDSAEVVLLKVHGGGHTWPGKESRLELLGPTTRNLDANQAIWEFFQRHRLPN